MIKTCLFSALLLATAFPAFGAETRTRYSHGDPTPDEQYMLELINRARANPAAEGKFLCNSGDDWVETAIDYFKVDLDRVRKDFASYPARPPLAFNPLLMSSARGHSTDMAVRKFQGHNSSDGTSFIDRLTQSGYPYSGLGESVYSLHVPDTLFAHVGFNIDWGPGAGGVQAGVGHRVNMMNFNSTVFKEVGIGVIVRTGSGAQSHGKLAITQDFGIADDSHAFLLGVVYVDRNANGICDPGEGKPGVSVSPSVGDSYAITSTSGGYAIPFSSAASGVLTFSGGGLDAAETRVFSIGKENLKIDLVTASAGETPVSLEVLQKFARENRGHARFLVRRSGPDDEALTVVIRRSKGGSRAMASFSDYSLEAATIEGANGGSSTFRVTLPKGKSSTVVTLKAKPDTKQEVDEKVTFSIKPTSHYRVAKRPPAKLVITR
ncbi:MAG: CAP domain-containing protein [Verrucomicrobiota bacterium]